MMPTVSPDAMCKSMSASAYFFAVPLYLNETLSKSTLPFSTVMIGFSGSVRSDFSDSTSPIRRMDSAEMVRMTYTIASIMSDMRIWMP